MKAAYSSLLVVALFLLCPSAVGCRRGFPDLSSTKEMCYSVSRAGDILVASTTRGAVLGLDRKDLSVIWRTELPEKGLVFLSPAPDSVIAFGEKGAMSRVMRDGSLVWTIPLSDGFPLAAFPSVLLCGIGNRITAYDLDKGTKAWSASLDEPFRSFAALESGFGLLLGGQVTCLSSLDGHRVWSKPCEGADSVVFDRGTGELVVAQGQLLSWLNPGNGDFVRSLSIGAKPSALAVLPSAVLVVTDRGKVTLLDKENGALLKEWDLDCRGDYEIHADGDFAQVICQPRPSFPGIPFPRTAIVLDAHECREISALRASLYVGDLPILHGRVYYPDWLRGKIVAVDLATSTEVLSADPLAADKSSDCFAAPSR